MILFLVLSNIFVMIAAVDQPLDTEVSFCGRELPKAWANICFGKQYHPKKSSPKRSIGELAEDWPWSGRRGALSAGWERYKRQGLADECCLKKCTIQVIKEFC